MPCRIYKHVYVPAVLAVPPVVSKHEIFVLRQLYLPWRIPRVIDGGRLIILFQLLSVNVDLALKDLHRLSRKPDDTFNIVMGAVVPFRLKYDNIAPLRLHGVVHDTVYKHYVPILKDRLHRIAHNAHPLSEIPYCHKREQTHDPNLKSPFPHRGKIVERLLEPNF